MREYKRYTIGNVLTKCSGLRENGRFMTFDEVVNLLNTQYNLIQSLQKTNDVLEENQERLNNQLKLSYQKITDLKEDLNDLDFINRELNFMLQEKRTQCDKLISEAMFLRKLNNGEVKDTNKLLNLIDFKIKEAEKEFEMSYEDWSQGKIDALKDLKQELQEVEDNG